jgi:hypothetical protein
MIKINMIGINVDINVGSAALVNECTKQEGKSSTIR